MAVPQVLGSYSSHNVGQATPDHVIDISSIPVGAWMVVSSMSAVSTTMTAPDGWTSIAYRIQSGTRQNFVYAKIRTVEDGNTATFTVGAVGNIAYGLLWGTGADFVANWKVGTQWLRNTSTQPTGARYDNIAKGVATGGSNRLVLAISNETTLAMTQQNEIAGVAPSGWTQSLWLPQVAANDRAETIWMGTKAMPTAGDSGDVTITYTSPQDANGWTIQLAIPPAIQPPALGEVGIVSTATAYSGDTHTTFSVNRPSGAQTGDYVVVIVRGQSSTTTVEPSSPGFSHLGPAFVSSTNNYRLNGFYGRPIHDVSTEPLTYPFSFTATDTNTRLLAVAVLVRGININAPLAGYYDNYSGTTTASGVRVESYAVADSPTFALFAAGSEFTTPNDHNPTSTPSGFIPVASLPSSSLLTQSRTHLWVGSRQESGMSIPAADITWGSPVAAAAEGIALRTTDDLVGSGYVAANGNGEQVTIYHTTEDGVRTPSKVLPMLRGFNSVADMLARPGFTWAHRGGSVSYPEMSLHAYTQAVARGYGVLEVSLGRTSDGVWFGLHDQTTDRTSVGTYGNASSQTWAQIQMQQNNLGPGAPQPYMSWDELVATYGHTHIIVADPKYALGSYRTEFLTMVNRDLGPTRAIIKYSGIGSGAAALSTAAKALGFETWGFFYAGDASAAQGGTGNLQTWGGNWTLLGMEYNASQAIWDEVLAFGKPVIGHIAPNQAAYNTAIAKGASGVQVSGVAVVQPVSWWTPSP